MPGRLFAYLVLVTLLGTPAVVSASEASYIVSGEYVAAVSGTGAAGPNALYRTGESAAEHFWFYVGIGGATNGTCYGLSASLLIRKHLLSIRYVFVEGEWYPDVVGNDTDWEVAFLYGRAVRSSYLQFSMSLGASMTGGDYAGDGEYGPAIGLPVESQLVYLANRFFGAGLCGYVNFNTERTGAGLLFAVYFGRLKNR